ncbi:MAG: anti-sigma factor [Acidobacteria bacterium]|nr:anti-sigma factor [Acidobacteriota bacterium]
MKDCLRLKEHYEAFVLGALEGEERAELDAHLARGCPVCTPGVAEARWVVAQLSHAAPDAEPPAALRARLMQRVAETKQLSVPQGEMSEEHGARFTIPFWAWAAAAAVVLFFAVTLWQARQFEEQLATVRSDYKRAQNEKDRLEAQRREMESILAVVAAPGTREVRLKGEGQSAPAVKAYWNEEQGVVLSAQKMPSLPTGRAFQLWVVPRKGNPLSAGVFQPDAAGNLLQLTRVEGSVGLKDAAALAITEEPAGGSPQPTSKPAWVGPII